METRQITITSKDAERIRSLFSTHQGKEVLGILEAIFETPLSYVIGDVNQTIFNEGHRNVIKLIKNIIKLGGMNEMEAPIPDEVIKSQY